MASKIPDTGSGIRTFSHLKVVAINKSSKRQSLKRYCQVKNNYNETSLQEISFSKSVGNDIENKSVIVDDSKSELSSNSLTVWPTLSLPESVDEPASPIIPVSQGLSQELTATCIEGTQAFIPTGINATCVEGTQAFIPTGINETCVEGTQAFIPTGINETCVEGTQAFIPTGITETCVGGTQEFTPTGAGVEGPTCSQCDSQETQDVVRVDATQEFQIEYTSIKDNPESSVSDIDDSSLSDDASDLEDNNVVTMKSVFVSFLDYVNKKLKSVNKTVP